MAHSSIPVAMKKMVINGILLDVANTAATLGSAGRSPPSSRIFKKQMAASGLSDQRVGDLQPKTVAKQVKEALSRVYRSTSTAAAGGHYFANNMQHTNTHACRYASASRDQAERVARPVVPTISLARGLPPARLQRRCLGRHVALTASQGVPQVWFTI